MRQQRDGAGTRQRGSALTRAIAGAIVEKPELPEPQLDLFQSPASPVKRRRGRPVTLPAGKRQNGRR